MIKMEDLLQQSATRLTRDSEDLLKPACIPTTAEKQDLNRLQTLEDATKALQSKPDIDFLAKILQWLFRTNTAGSTFSIKIPGPQAAQVINVLVNQTVPDYWDVLKNDNSAVSAKVRRLLLGCLTSLAGIGALITRLRSLITQRKHTREKTSPTLKNKTSNDLQPILDMMDVLETILQKDNAIAGIWKDLHSLVTKPVQPTLLWKELGSIIATGKLLSVVAEANDVVNSATLTVGDGSWLGNGHQYTLWLGRNISFMIGSDQGDSMGRTKEAAQLFSKALTLGYTDQIVNVVFIRPLIEDANKGRACRPLLNSLAIHEQKTVLQSTLRILSKIDTPSTQSMNGSSATADITAKTVRGMAALLVTVMGSQVQLREALADWLTSTSGGSIGVDDNTRRATTAVLAQDQELFESTLSKLLQLFGDKLYIKHTPVLHQEVNAQILLLVAGYVHRSNATYLERLTRSSVYINAISNRLAASSSRSRFLGMVVGNAVSELVDPKDKRMNFSVEEIDKDDGKRYRGLINVSDSIGDISDLKLSLSASTTTVNLPKEMTRSVKGVASKPAPYSKVISIEEVDDDSASEDEDLPIYDKPDSDEEDEDEDPTLVQRNKPTAPVYIRDLIAGLRDIDNYDRHKLALVTAPSLIRRKANFGTEVSDHIDEIATQLVGLGDKYNLENFPQLRLQGMIAALIARPLQMGQWFANTFFNGEYSMGQRASILTTLSMGARELAGFQTEDAAVTGADAVPNFPSKRLPDKLHKIYAVEAAPVDALTQRLERTMIRPMAAEAADKLTGPKALKVRTFSSRMEVEKKRKKAIPNELAKIVADGFFFPLTGRWQIHLQAYGDRSPHTSPFLLSHFLKTLSLLLHASGPSTMSLPQMTSEFWSLLLSLRPRALNDIAILEALLFAILTLLDVNDDKRRVAEEHAKELLETQA
ncbi:MAG: hypothetical protein Q9187_002558, partial [Circinaria calcarea]